MTETSDNSKKTVKKKRRNHDAQFKKGVSGNPSGRPKGIIDKRMQVKGLLQEKAPELVQKAIDMAMGGDVKALKLCIERIIPRVTEETLNFNFLPPQMNKTSSLPTIAEGIFRGIEQGELTPSQGKQLLDALHSYKETIISAEIVGRLEKLEDKPGT